MKQKHHRMPNVGVEQFSFRTWILAPLPLIPIGSQHKT